MNNHKAPACSETAKMMKGKRREKWRDWMSKVICEGRSILPPFCPGERRRSVKCYACLALMFIVFSDRKPPLESGVSMRGGARHLTAAVLLSRDWFSDAACLTPRDGC